MWQFVYISSAKRIRAKALSGKKMRIVFVSANVFVLQQDQTSITQEDPKGFTWHKH